MKPSVAQLDSDPQVSAVDLDAVANAIGRWAPLPPDRTREVLHAAVEALRVTSDDVAVQAIDVLAMELADVADRLTVRELMLSQALQLAHDQHREIIRLKTRVHDLLDLARTTRQSQ